MKKSIVIHPFLIAIFPILFLFSHNIGQTSLNQIVIPTTITTFITFLLWLLLSFIFKDKEKAGLTVSLFLLLFFSYGDFYSLIGDFVFCGARVGANKILFFIYALLFLFGAYFFIGSGRRLNNFTNVLNIAASSLIVMSLANIGAYTLKKRVAFQDNSVAGNIETDVRDIEKLGTLPDIVYDFAWIRESGYSRRDI